MIATEDMKVTIGQLTNGLATKDRLIETSAPGLGPETMMTAAEVAARLDVATSVVYALVRTDQLDHYRICCTPGKRGYIRVSEGQLRQYILSDAQPRAFRNHTPARSSVSTRTPYDTGWMDETVRLWQPRSANIELRHRIGSHLNQEFPEPWRLGGRGIQSPARAVAARLGVIPRVVREMRTFVRTFPDLAEFRRWCPDCKSWNVAIRLAAAIRQARSR